MGGERHVPHLVQEQRAAVGVGDAAFFVRDRPGEGPLDVPEELGLDEALGQRRAVHRDEVARLAAAVVVHRARDELLARTALTEHQHRHIRRRHTREHVEDAQHLRRAPEDLLEAEALVELPLELHVLVA